ncbi:glutathione S-transferase family protein [Microvirga sp. M2]|uniref:glutathione S-transferase family protein n=1 Tax=Microvirga sp. M2 TaxID=3073270 RepID=UPI0039C2889B
MYKLYYSPGACSMAVHIVLEELGVLYELELVSVQSGATSHPAYLAINPKGRVPALARDGEVLTEVSALLVYLADNHTEPQLLPSDAWLAGRCHEWLSWLSSEVHPAFAQVWRPERSVEATACQADVQAKGRANIRARLEEIEGRLARTDGYAVGNQYTVVDPYLLVYFGWGRYVGLDMAEYPAFTRHAALVSSRQAVRRVMKQEGLLKAA